MNSGYRSEMYGGVDDFLISNVGELINTRHKLNIRKNGFEMKLSHQQIMKNNKELKLAHFERGLIFKKKVSEDNGGEENVGDDKYYQSIEPQIIHSKNKLLYFDQLCVASQLPPLLSMKLFPNGKEISESLSAYYSIRDYLEFKNELNILSNRNVICYVIADGNVPRTAAVFACATNWRVFSIDPRMKQKWLCKFIANSSDNDGDNEEGQPKEHDFVEGLEAVPSIPRLYPFSMTSSEFLQTLVFKKAKSRTTELSVIVAVHSHADLWEFYNEIPSPKLCLEIPCCYHLILRRNQSLPSKMKLYTVKRM